MARPVKVLRCVLNPFAHLDHDGRPACAVAFEPNPLARGTEPKRFHGAKLHATVIEERNPTVVQGGCVIAGDDRKSVHDHTFEFSHGAVLTLPDTRYYRELLTPAAGQVATPLLPADTETARKLGRPFRDPELTIAETAEVTSAEWTAANDGEQPEFLTLDLAAEDAKIAAKQPSDVHPAHRAAARYLAKVNPKKAAERAAQAEASETFKAKLEAKAKADVEAAKAKADADAKSAAPKPNKSTTPDAAPPKGPSVIDPPPTTNDTKGST